MAQDNNRKKNITGSYPGVTGAYNPPNKKQPREFTQPDSINPPVRPRYDFEKTGRVPLTSENDITANVERTGEITAAFKKAGADTSGDTRVNMDRVTPKRPVSDGYTRVDTPQVKNPRPAPQTPAVNTVRESRQTPPPKSEQVKKKTEKPRQDGFEFKKWFSSDNVKRYLIQVRYYGIILIVSLLLTFGIVTAANDAFAFIKPDESIVVNIPQGSNTKAVAKALDKAGIIDHPLVFRLYSKLKKADGTFQYGDYTLNSNLGYDQIIAKLKRASVQAETVTFTVPVGATQDDIVTMLTAGKYFSAEDLDTALNKYDYEKHPWVSELPERRCRLEGYLIAGDYEMSKGESAVTVVGRMLARFEETVLTEENKALITASGLTTDQVVTMASLLQAECDLPALYKPAAAVLFNRLRAEIPMYLQLTSPINYVLSQPKPTLSADDRRTDSEYNTYLYTGLPKGPVCNPSVDAIAAVLVPDISENMYFISDGESYYYAVTAAEHEQNLAKASDTAKGTDTIR